MSTMKSWGSTSAVFTPTKISRAVPLRRHSPSPHEGRAELGGWRVRKDGSRFWAHVVVDAIRDETGTHIGFAKITRDITERREAAEALDRANAALFPAQ